MEFVKNFCMACVNFKKVSVIRKCLKFLPKEIVDEITLHLEHNIPGGVLTPLPISVCTAAFSNGEVCYAHQKNIFIKEHYANGIFCVKEEVGWAKSRVEKAVYGVFCEEKPNVSFGKYSALLFSTGFFMDKKQLFVFPDLVKGNFVFTPMLFDRKCDVLHVELGFRVGEEDSFGIVKNLFGSRDGIVMDGVIFPDPKTEKFQKKI